MAGGSPLVVEEPSSETAAVFMELAACVVREVAKLQMQPRASVRYALPIATPTTFGECPKTP
jgi:hypothetical protein